MILQELVQYYDRQRALPDSDIAPRGWVRRPLDYVLVLRGDGECVNLLTQFTLEKGKRIARAALLPAIGKQALKHTNSGKDANLLWDNASFVLGWGDHKASKLNSFIEAIQHWFPNEDDDGVRAVLGFLGAVRQQPERVRSLIEKFGVLADFEQRDPTLAFQLLGDGVGLVHEREALRHSYAKRSASAGSDATRGNCLISGARGVALADNETVIKGVWGAQSSGANLISFNAASFESYGKRDRNGENAPVSAEASAAYSTALNHLLGSPRSRVQVGDTSTIFWADRSTPFESLLADLFGENKDDPARGTRTVQALHEAIKTGQLPVGEEGAQFYVLGLAPNAARIGVRFWLKAPLAQLAPRVLRHFDDLKVVRRYDGDPLTPSLFRLLSSLALQGKLDNVPPTLAGEWMRTILEGLPYPSTLLNAAVNRCKAEQDVTYLRAAVLKAWLNSEHRRANPETPLSEQHFKESLDMEQSDTPYLLGRLFAVLERVQEESARPAKLNSTIRDRYYGAASTTPVAVFTTLLRLKNAHMKKLGRGSTIRFEKLIGEISGTVEHPRLNDFPRQLTLHEQGRFALGYYHQRQDFYASKQDIDAQPEEVSEEN